MDAPFSLEYLRHFEELWADKNRLQEVTDVVIDNISSAYNENSPELIYFMTLYHVFSEFLDDISEDVLPNEAIDNQNRIHPFYMVYMGIDGSVICDYLNPKQLLDDVRLLCRGRKEPIKEVYTIFNEETEDGRNMEEDDLPVKLEELDIDVVYENFVKQIAGDKLQAVEAGESLKDTVAREEEKEALKSKLQISRQK